MQRRKGSSAAHRAWGSVNCQCPCPATALPGLARGSLCLGSRSPAILSPWGTHCPASAETVCELLGYGAWRRRLSRGWRRTQLPRAPGGVGDRLSTRTGSLGGQGQSMASEGHDRDWTLGPGNGTVQPLRGQQCGFPPCLSSRLPLTMTEARSSPRSAVSWTMDARGPQTGTQLLGVIQSLPQVAAPLSARPVEPGHCTGGVPKATAAQASPAQREGKEGSELGWGQECVNPAAAMDKPRGVQSRRSCTGCNEVTDSTASWCCGPE